MKKTIIIAFATWASCLGLLSAFNYANAKLDTRKPDFRIEQGCIHVEGEGFMIFATLPTQFEVKTGDGRPLTFRGPNVWNIACSRIGCTGAMFNMAAAHETKSLTSVMLQPLYRTRITEYSRDGATIVGQSMADRTKTQKFTLDFNTGKFTFETETDEIKIVGEGNVGRCKVAKGDDDNDTPGPNENPNPTSHQSAPGTIEL